MGDSVDTNLHTFYRWCSEQKKKVMTERVVIGSIIGVHGGKLSSGETGISVVSNSRGGKPSWEHILGDLALRFQREAGRGQGKFACVLLDGDGVTLEVAKMVEQTSDTEISKLLIILGGPDGIPDNHKAQLGHMLKKHAGLPLVKIGLLGGKMHSYYALGTLLAFHDQGILLPHLSYLAEHRL